MKTIINTLKAISLIALIILFSYGDGLGAKNTKFQRQGAVGFSIGTKGYIGTGAGYVYTTSYRKDFWEYNPATDSWTQKADFGGTARYLAAGFSIGDKGYIGMGVNDSGYPTDLWQYNSVTNVWTNKADFPGGRRTTPVCFSIGSKGYVGTGRGSVMFPDGCYETKELWEYDPSIGAGGTWTRKADFGGLERQGAAGFSIGEKGYIGAGIHYVSSTNYTFLNDFWEYDPSMDKWTQKANAGGLGRTYAIGFYVGTKGYICGGNGTGGHFTDFLEYNPETNTWSQKATFVGIARSFSVGFSIGTKGYIGTGFISPGVYVQDFWEYNQITNAWTRKTDFGSQHKGPLKDETTSEETALILNELLNVYPNPSKYLVNLDFTASSNEKIVIRLTDFSGRTINVSEFSAAEGMNHYTIDLNDYHNGVYFIAVTSGTQKYLKKLVVAK